MEKRLLYEKFIRVVPDSVAKWLFDTGQLPAFRYDGALLRWDTDKNGNVVNAVILARPK